MSRAAEEIIRALGLEPLPIEGGFFRESYRSQAILSGPDLPPCIRRDATRSLATSIYYMLTPDTFSEMHRLPTEEIFHVYPGGPVRMLQLLADGSGRELVLGTEPSGRSPAPGHRSGGRMARVAAGAGRRVRAPGHDDESRVRHSPITSAAAGPT